MPKSCSFLTTLVIFGISVQDVLQSCRPDDVRDKDVLDLFCGAAAIHRAAVDSGFTSSAFDKFRIPGITDSSRAGCSEDVSSKIGFMHALELVKRLKRGGLLVMGPPCSSFVMLNAAKCKRKAHNNYQGDLSYPRVQMGNLLATAAAFLMTVAYMRGVEVIFENPPCSTIWKFPVVKQVLDFCVLRSTCTPRCAWSTEPFGKRMLKRFKFACTGMWISDIRRQCRCPRRRHLHLTRSVWTNGKRKFTGRGHALKKSAAYPDALGRAIVNAWSQSSAFHTSSRRPHPASNSTPAWLQPCPCSTSASTRSRSYKGRVEAAALSSAPSWLQPVAGAASELVSSRRGSDPGAPTWLNPTPSSH